MADNNPLSRLMQERNTVTHNIRLYANKNICIFKSAHNRTDIMVFNIIHLEVK